MAALIAAAQAKLGQRPGDPSQQATRRRRKKNAAVLYLTEEEQAALFRAIEAELDAARKAKKPSRVGRAIRDLALFEVAYHRGLRASEVGLLQFAHLRLAQRRLYVTRLKGGISGEYLITDREVKALKAWLKERGNLSGPLFPSRNHRAISRRRLDEPVKRYAPSAGIPATKQHFHCLRHSCATALLDRDVPIEEVQDHLGHVDIRNTMGYAKVTNAKRRRKDERLQKDF